MCPQAHTALALHQPCSLPAMQPTRRSAYLPTHPPPTCQHRDGNDDVEEVIAAKLLQGGEVRDAQGRFKVCKAAWCPPGRLSTCMAVPSATPPACLLRQQTARPPQTRLLPPNPAARAGLQNRARTVLAPPPSERYSFLRRAFISGLMLSRGGCTQGGSRGGRGSGCGQRIGRLAAGVPPWAAG